MRATSRGLNRNPRGNDGSGRKDYTFTVRQVLWPAVDSFAFLETSQRLQVTSCIRNFLDSAARLGATAILP